MRYELKLMNTESGVGHFTAIPGPNLSFAEILDHLHASPMDSYMHHFMLTKLGEHRTRKLEKLMKEVRDGQRKDDHVLSALLREACLTHLRFTHLLPKLDWQDLDELEKHTPAMYIRAERISDKDLHNQWIKLLRNNIIYHESLPSPEDVDLKNPVEINEPAIKNAAEVLAEIREDLPSPKPRPSLNETIIRVNTELMAARAYLTPEMAHRASLSPHALLRHWVINTRCSTGRHANTLEGMQTSYGRGLDLDSARASYMMELAERLSSYASTGKGNITGYQRNHTLVYGSYEEVSANANALNPNYLRLEVPYSGQSLYWFECETPGNEGPEPILIPVQLVFLFCNLDEPDLFSALGSTGLASGNTEAEARLSGLCEVLERDAMAVTPFDFKNCFRVEASDTEVGKLLADYEANGIHVWFMDMTSEFGIPCYKSVVTGTRGDVNQGMGCGLSGKRALISAMTETTYPFPGPPSATAPDGLPVRRLEDLPDLTTGSAEGDLLVIEKTLKKHGFSPIYADLTRKDLKIPVARAIVPGLEIVADFDRFSRVSPRLLRNYLKMFDK